MFIVNKDSFIKKVLSFEGQMYCWPCKENNYSGKGFSTAKYKDCHDCSGVVTDALYLASDFKIDLRSTHNAQQLYNLSKKIAKPIDGDLVFYGKDKDHISHVMVFIGGKVFGASGGDSKVITPEISASVKASVRYQSSPLYRKDLVGYGRIVNE